MSATAVETRSDFMSRRVAHSKRQRHGIISPTGLFSRIRLACFSGLWLALLGMVTLFGGTRFWAAGPFVLMILSVAVGFGLFSMRQAGKRNVGVALPPDFIFWFGILAYVAVRAAFFSPIPFETWTEFCFWWIAWVLYGLMADLGNQPKAWMLAAYVLLVGVCFHTGWSIIQHGQGSRMVLWVPRPDGYEMRASGTFICPNHYAHFLMMGIVVVFSCLLTPRAHLFLRIFSGYVLILACGVLVLSHSRSGLIGAFAGMSVIGLGKAMRRGRKRVLMTCLGVASTGAVIIFLFLNFYPPMRARIVRGVTDNIRISQLWPDTWSMIKAEGLWGAAPGVYANVFEKYRERFDSAAHYAEYAHNEILHFLAEYGWIVSLYFLGLLIWMGWVWLRAAVESPSETAAMIPLTMLALLVGSLAHAVFDFNLHIPANALLLVALLGALYGQGVYLDVWRKHTVWKPKWTRRGYLLAALSSLVLIPFVLRVTAGSLYEYRMRQAIDAKQPAERYRYASAMRQWMPWYARGWTQKGIEFRDQAFWLLDGPDKNKAVSESRDAYETAIRKNPYDDIALAGLVELAKMEENQVEALRRITELRNIDPFDVQVRIQQGLILRKLGRYQEALDVFMDARKMRGAPAKQIQLNIKRLRQFLAEEAVAEK